MKAQKVTAPMDDSDVNSSDQSAHIFHEDPAAVIVHVPDDVNDEPGDRSLSTQYASVIAEEKIKSHQLQTMDSSGKQIPEDMKMEKVQELFLASLDEDEKDAGKYAQQPKEVLDGDEKQHPEEVQPDKLNGDEVPDTSMSSEAAMYDQDQVILNA